MKEMSKASSRIITLDFRKAGFAYLGIFLAGSNWYGAQDSWLIFKEKLP